MPDGTAINSMWKTRRNGITLIELLVVIAIVSILASAAMPLSRMTIKRQEIELRNNLRILRTAIDAFKKDCDGKKLPMVEGYCVADQDNYPETLEQLTQPLKLTGDVDKTRNIFVGSPEIL